jgi:CIC family chloride channel protein
MCYSSGNAGGIFGPSLFIGATMGAAVGSVAHTLFPGSTAGPGAYALVGMGTAFAGIVRTPLTSVIMIFEVTRDYTIIVPLMISNLVAYFISSKLQPVPIYEALAHQDGVHLPGPEGRAEKSTVAGVMRTAPAPLSSEQTVAGAIEQITMEQTTGEPLAVWPVADTHGMSGVNLLGMNLLGMVRRAELEALAAQGLGDSTLAGILKPLSEDDPSAAEFPHVHPDHGLHLALERMGSTGLDVIPVVSRANVRQLLGIVVLSDILRAYGVDRTSQPTEEMRHGVPSQPEESSRKVEN